MMSKNSIVPFLKDYLIKFLTRPFLLDTNDIFITTITTEIQEAIRNKPQNLSRSSLSLIYKTQ